MGSEMSFTHPLVRGYLAEHGIVYTMRSFMYTVRTCAVDGLGLYERYYVKEIKDKVELEPYLDQSGFDTVDEWWAAADRYKCNPRYLWKVERLR